MTDAFGIFGSGEGRYEIVPQKINRPGKFGNRLSSRFFYGEQILCWKCSLVCFLQVVFCMNPMPFLFGCSIFSSCSQRCYKLAKSLSYIFPFLLQEPMQRRERKSRIYNCRPLAEERRNCQHMQECGNPPPPFHSGLPWMDGPKERRRRKEPDSFSLFVSSRFMKIAKKGGNGLLANEGRRLAFANK